MIVGGQHSIAIMPRLILCSMALEISILVLLKETAFFSNKFASFYRYHFVS